MNQDSDNQDYKAGKFFVFDDKLGFPDDTKYMLEASLDHLSGQCSTFGASVTPPILTAEKKTKPDGSPYVLIRRATPSEKRAFVGKDDDIDEEYYEDLGVCHVWTAPSMQGLYGVMAPRSGAVMCPASMCGTHDRGP